MIEEDFVARAEVVQPRLAVWCVDKSVLGAAAVACETYLTFAAILGKLVELILSKPILLI